ncbi:hypothetical protein GCM10010255_49250 [Streptomyces coeruleofuscus]|uniref:Transposase n=1 Tax=Streptomyces coeruleofuscus TaxID=66879 RepID=A0ABP5VSJ0_9ACTN
MWRGGRAAGRSMPRARPAKPRNTLYGEIPQERQRAAEVSDGHLPELLPVLDWAAERLGGWAAGRLGEAV